MLNIMSMAYQSADADSFTDEKQSVEIRRTQIFAAYVDKMFQRKEALGPVFPKEKVIIWLSGLARQMTAQSQSVFFVENLQPSGLDSWKQRLAYRGIASLVFGFIFSLLFILVFGWPYTDIDLILGLSTTLAIGLSIRSDSSIRNGIACTLTFGLLFGLISGAYNDDWIHDLGFGLFLGLIVGLVASVGIGILNCIRTVETINWSWKSFLIKSVKILFFTIAVMIAGILFLISEFDENPNQLGIMSLSFIFMPIGGLIIGIIGGFTNRIREDKTRPNQGIILSLKSGVYAGLMVGLIIGLIVWLITTAKVGLVAGIFIGLIIGLNRGLGDAIKHYVLRLVLWRNGRIPYKFVPFLDYCAKLILLKKVGGGYIFIHRMLLEYFAKLGVADGNSTK